jgi:hypothetical protein
VCVLQGLDDLEGVDDLGDLEDDDEGRLGDLEDDPELAAYLEVGGVGCVRGGGGGACDQGVCEEAGAVVVKEGQRRH